ncbi:uncharacterized protein LOC127752110 [Frankliniella occidentalis]|uniref:Uncharacterized protein LOC127752110 n=1 Tax=Frankliniella occidentalis TaxID=133901 RepID=A0A9C6XB94_FRAOC|nr:uncharacterized protein LOC127752110 [Frankliniella occidentalis]
MRTRHPLAKDDPTIDAAADDDEAGRAAAPVPSAPSASDRISSWLRVAAEDTVRPAGAVGQPSRCNCLESFVAQMEEQQAAQQAAQHAPQRRWLERQERVARLQEREARLPEREARMQEREARLQERVARLEEREARLKEREARLQEYEVRMDILEMHLGLKVPSKQQHKGDREVLYFLLLESFTMIWPHLTVA